MLASNGAICSEWYSTQGVYLTHADWPRRAEPTPEICSRAGIYLAIWVILPYFGPFWAIFSQLGEIRVGPHFDKINTLILHGEHTRWLVNHQRCIRYPVTTGRT